MKDFIETIATIPFFRIAINIFRGGFGWRTPLAFILQVVLQTVCAFYWLQLPVAGAVVVAVLLSGLHLCTGLLIALQPLSGMSPKPTYQTEREFIRLAVMISVIMGGIGSLLILGSSSFLVGAGLKEFGHSLSLSVIGGTLVHLFGVVFPIIKASRQ